MGIHGKMLVNWLVGLEMRIMEEPLVAMFGQYIWKGRKSRVGKQQSRLMGGSRDRAYVTSEEGKTGVGVSGRVREMNQCSLWLSCVFSQSLVGCNCSRSFSLS